MNKSTPINQLPINPMMQNSFVNEPQRQMVTNAQQAIGNHNMPQNTQVANDIDDDIEIKEALNDVNMQLQMQAPPPPQIPSTPQMSQHQMQEMAKMQNMMPNVPVENPEDVLFMQGAQYHDDMNNNHERMMAAQYAPSYAMGPQGPHPSLSPSMAPPPMPVQYFTLMDYVMRFADDLKLAVIVLGVVIAVHFVPFHTFIGKYISLNNIPYHDILIRGLVAAVVIVLLKNLIVFK